MNKKEIITPLLIIGLSLLFIIVSAGVFLSKGRSHFWISKKMKIGALLISLNAIINQSCERIFPITCYDPPRVDEIEIDLDNYTGIFEVDLKISNKITGMLYDRTGIDYSFNITDTLNADTVQVGVVKAVDGNFDNSTEEIFIELDNSLKSNTYNLNFYKDKLTQQNYPQAIYRIVVKNED